MGPFAEAVRATFQPCTFLLIVPIVVASFVARNRWRSLAAILGSAVVGGWLVAANWFILDGALLRLSALAVGLALVAIALPVFSDHFELLRSEPAVAAVAGATASLATMWWRPCVGDQLGTVLTGAQNGLAGQLLPMAIYMSGAMVPVVIVVLAHHALAPAERVTTMVSWVALGIGLLVTGSLVVGQHDRVVVTLTRWTLE